MFGPRFPMTATTKMLLVFLGLLGAALALPRTPGLRLVWEINLNDRIEELAASTGASPHSVLDISFSPNDEYIAASFGIHSSSPAPRPGSQDYFSHIVIVPTKNPEQGFRQVDPGVLVLEGLLSWSPRSTRLLLKGYHKYLQINADGPASRFEELSCRPPGIVEGYLDERRFLTFSLPEDSLRSPRPAIRTLSIFDSRDCRLLDQWSPSEGWYITDLEPRRGVAAAYHMLGRTREDFVFDLDSKRIVQRWQNNFDEKFFAETGRSLCAITMYWRDHPGPVCWDIATGKIIAALPEINGGLPASVARYSSRILLSDVKVFRGITEEYDMHQFRRRVIWDFRTGKEVASWIPATQSEEMIHHAPKADAALSAVALSPSGRYVAEGANGVLRLYEVEGGDTPTPTKGPPSAQN